MAAAIPTPGFSRAITSTPLAGRLAGVLSLGGTLKGTHRSAALSTSGGDGVDEQLYLIRHERVEAHEFVLCEVSRTRRRLETDVGVQLAAVGSEPVAYSRLPDLALV